MVRHGNVLVNTIQCKKQYDIYTGQLIQAITSEYNQSGVIMQCNIVMMLYTCRVLCRLQLCHAM